VQITTLLENHTNKADANLQAEHGLSFYIEHGGHVFMSDVGQSGLFADNAKKLGIDLSLVEGLVISHHHFDHGGGLARFFEENDRATVFLRRAADAEYLAVDPSNQETFIGIDKELLMNNSDRIKYVDENSEVFEGLHLLTDIPENYPKPGGGNRLKMRREGKLLPDTFEHELVTVLEGDEQLVVLTGCAHNGVLNMIAATREVFPEKLIKAVIGGFHLSHEEDSRVVEVGEALAVLELSAVYTGHCTGDRQTGILQSVLGDRLHWLHTGLVIEFLNTVN